MKINFIIILTLCLQLAANAQLHINSGEEILVSGTENLYTIESFSNAGKLSIAAEGTASLNGGSASGTGTIKGTSTSSLLIGGNSTSGTYYFDQTTAGNTNVFKNLTLSGTASATLGNALNIVGGATPGTVIVGSGTTLNTGGFLNLKSDANGTASIGTSAGTISGNVTVERYLSGGYTKGRWRFLSSPVTGKTISHWMSQFYVTGPCTTAPTTIGALNDQGWHSNYANTQFPGTSSNSSVLYTSIRTYNETNSSSNINIGWANLTGNTQAITPGLGFRAFVRGNNNNDPTNASYTSQIDGSANANTQSSFVLSLNGGVTNGANAGDVNMPITFTSSGTLASDGWNLLGNPYPSAYDWNAFYDDSTNLTNINPTVYVFDATNNAYVSYNASTNAPATGTNQQILTSGYIPSGASFFIQTNAASPSMTFKESFKTTGNAKQLHKSVITDEFNIKYYKDSTESDNLFIKMFEGATLKSEKYDIQKMGNENLNLSAYGADSINLYMSAIPPVNSETRIKLNVEATTVGTYKFEFTNMDNFDVNVSVSLLDKYTNKTINVKANTKYTFEMGPGLNQWGKNRFELILNGNTNTSINQANIIANTHLIVYPNPATDLLNINISNASFKNSSISISSFSGQQFMNSTMNGANAQVNIEGLSNGVYFVTVSNENGFLKTVKFVK